MYRLVSFYLKEKEIGKLNPQLYQNYERTVRIGMDKELGQLNLILKYKGKTRNLSVTLVSGKDFPPRDFSGTIDTCVTVCVLPHRERRKRTAIHRRSMNPLYNENFVFNIQLGEDTHAHSLLLITYFYDSFSHAHVLGQCYVPLIYCDFSSETIVWCYLDHPYGSVSVVILTYQFFFFFFHASLNTLFYFGVEVCNSKFTFYASVFVWPVLEKQSYMQVENNNVFSFSPLFVSIFEFVQTWPKILYLLERLIICLHSA